jgi:hypothetical protein
LSDGGADDHPVRVDVARGGVVILADVTLPDWLFYLICVMAMVGCCMLSNRLERMLKSEQDRHE